MTPDPQWVRGHPVGDRVGGRWAGSRGRVDRELAEEFAGGSVDDADVQVLNKHQDLRAGVGTAYAYVVELPADAGVSLPLASMRSVRTRSWVPTMQTPRVALGRATQVVAGDARCTGSGTGAACCG